MNSRLTLRDVARMAGVSTGTVSMVLNDSPLVARETRAYVQRVLEESGYVYNRRAANLRRRRSDIVGIAVADLTNPFLTEVLAGAQAVLDRGNRVALLANTQESRTRQAAFVRAIREQDAAGLLLVAAAGTTGAMLRESGVLDLPTVLLCRAVAGVELDFVGIDNVRAGELATEHLWSLGHRRIGYVGPSRGTTPARDRAAGYRRVLQRHGATVDESLVASCPPSREGGFAAMSALLRSRRRPTAVLCINDWVAFGAMHALRRHGLEPGADFAVIGCDGSPESAMWMPGLSTVMVSGGEIGALGAQILFDRLAHPEAPAQQHILAPTLVVRGSTDREVESVASEPSAPRAPATAGRRRSVVGEGSR